MCHPHRPGEEDEKDTKIMLNSHYREVSDQLYCAFSHLITAFDEEAIAKRNKLCLKVAARKAARHKENHRVLPVS